MTDFSFCLGLQHGSLALQNRVKLLNCKKQTYLVSRNNTKDLDALERQPRGEF